MKYKLKILVTAAFLSLFIAACTADSAVNGGGNSAVPPLSQEEILAELAAAKIVYDKSCVKCHQDSGAGGEIKVKDVSIKIPAFQNPKVSAESDAEYVKIIENGNSAGMPRYKGKLTDEQINSLVKYIRRTFQSK